MYGIIFRIFLAVHLVCQVSAARQTTLTNKHLRVGIVPAPPYIILHQDDNGQTRISGLVGDLIDNIQKARNCTFTAVIPPDGQWGDCYGNNSCTGMIGLVNRREVDFSLGSCA